MFITGQKYEDELYKMITAFIITSVGATLLLIYPEIASEAVKQSLDLLVKSFIPAMFCFMAVSRFAFKTGAVKLLNPILKPLARLLKLSDEEMSCFVIGNICGYPNGALISSEIISSRTAKSKSDYSLAAVSNNVSVGFAVLLCGKEYLSSSAAGAVIFLSQLISAVILGAIVRRKLEFTVKADRSYKTVDIPTCICDSIKESAVSTLHLCGFIVYFYVISEYIRAAMISADVPDVIVSVVSSLIEISGGCKEASTLEGSAAIAVISFACGFSGFCVIFQSVSYMRSSGMNIGRYFLFKILQGIMTAALSEAVLAIIGFEHNVKTPVVPAAKTNVFCLIDCLLISIFILINIFNNSSNKEDII